MGLRVVAGIVAGLVLFWLALVTVLWINRPPDARRHASFSACFPTRCG